MNLDVSLSILLVFSTACYLLLGVRLIGGKREVGSLPIGILCVVVSIWVMGGAIELMSTTYEAFSAGRTGHPIQPCGIGGSAMGREEYEDHLEAGPFENTHKLRELRGVPGEG